MLVNYSLQESLKSSEAWRSNSEDSELSLEKITDLSLKPRKARQSKKIKKEVDPEEQKRILKNLEMKEKRIKFERDQEAEIRGISIVEFPNPTGVFIIVQTNFFASKI